MGKEFLKCTNVIRASFSMKTAVKIYLLKLCPGPGSKYHYFMLTLEFQFRLHNDFLIKGHFFTACPLEGKILQVVGRILILAFYRIAAFLRPTDIN